MQSCALHACTSVHQQASHAMQAIASWAEAETRYAERAKLPFAAAHAVEVGAWMLPSLTTTPGDDDEPAGVQVIYCTWCTIIHVSHVHHTCTIMCGIMHASVHSLCISYTMIHIPAYMYYLVYHHPFTILYDCTHHCMTHAFHYLCLPVDVTHPNASGMPLGSS